MGRRAARERVRCRKGPTKGRKNAWVWTRLKSACALHSSSLPPPPPCRPPPPPLAPHHRAADREARQRRRARLLVEHRAEVERGGRVVREAAALPVARRHRADGAHPLVDRAASDRAVVGAKRREPRAVAGEVEADDRARWLVAA